ncbi:MAG: hypothetical protein R3F34_08315 [Planctomycetota bacterium]
MLWGANGSVSPEEALGDLLSAHGATADDGTFELEVARSSVHRFQIDVRPGERPTRIFVLGEQSDGARTDVGTLAFELGGRIHGTLLDENGAALGIPIALLRLPPRTRTGRTTP